MRQAVYAFLGHLRRALTQVRTRRTRPLAHEPGEILEPMLDGPGLCPELWPGRCAVSDLNRLVELGRTFGTIYADPPWRYHKQTRGAAAKHYPTLPLEALLTLPIRELAAEHAHLHLWTTTAFLFEAKAVMDAWGFTYKSAFIWVKPELGMGNYWRISHEFLLLGVRGHCPFRDRSQRSWMEAGRGVHSSKPDRIRTLIERVSPPPYLELFGRRLSPGWTVWGDQIERTLFDTPVLEL